MTDKTINAKNILVFLKESNEKAGNLWWNKDIAALKARDGFFDGIDLNDSVVIESLNELNKIMLKMHLKMFALSKSEVNLTLKEKLDKAAFYASSNGLLSALEVVNKMFTQAGDLNLLNEKLTDSVMWNGLKTLDEVSISVALSYGADAFGNYPGEDNALIQASRNNLANSVELFLNAGLSPLEKSRNGLSAAGEALVGSPFKGTAFKSLVLLKAKGILVTEEDKLKIPYKTLKAFGV